MKKYQIIYADPPWLYNSVIHRNTRKRFKHVSEHYEVMRTQEIKMLPVWEIAGTNCLLFLWVTSPLLPDGLDVLLSWGFKYGTVAFCWNKVYSMPGSYTITQVELCLVGRKGKIPQPRGARNMRQYYEEKRSRHSQKPQEIQNRISTMFPTQEKIELFARQKVEGWDVWGNEVESDIELLNRKAV